MLLPLIAVAAIVQPQPGANPVTEHRIDQPPPPKIAPLRERAVSAVRTEGIAAPIQTITFRGVEAPKKVADAAIAFLGRPATRETLIELAGALSQAYEKTDVALFTVAIPEQDFRDGILVVDLIEGWVNSVAVNAPGGTRFRLLEARAAKLVGEKPLSRARFERQSSLMQSIPGLELDASFENPEGDDSVSLHLTPRQKRVEGALGINNRGPNLLGDMILQAGLDFYRLVTDGDQLSFSGYATPNFRNYRAVDATYAFPIGVDGLTLSATGGWIHTRARSVDIRGEAKFAGLTLTYPILRRASRAADVSFGIDGVNSDNALFGNIFSTERTRAVRLAGALATSSEAGAFQASASISKGLDILGADAGDTGSEGEFTKANASGGYERLLAPRLLGRLTAIIQYTDDRLPASELMAAGGAVIGRAFDTGLVTGDRGIGGIVELAYRPIDAGDFQQSEAYAFVDAASLRLKSRPLLPGQTFSLASAGIGARAKYKDRMEFGVEGAAVLDRPYAGYDDDYRLSVYYSVLF